MKYECCHHPAIQTMDYKYPVFAEFSEQVTKINRICLRCYTHWFGVEGDVKQFTRKEWDAMIEGAL